MSKGRDCHPYGAHVHDLEYRVPENHIVKSNERLVGDGILRNHAHDAGLQREVGVWRHEIELSGGTIVQEFNSNDLSRMLGQKAHRQMSYKDKVKISSETGFPMLCGEIKVPDHRFVIAWPDGRMETKDLEHINPNTYNSHQKRAKIAVARSSSNLHLTGVGGRRSQGGPDMITGLVSPSRPKRSRI